MTFWFNLVAFTKAIQEAADALIDTHHDLINHINAMSTALQKAITMSSQDTINAIVAQLAKAKAEILDELAKLQAQVDAGQPVDLSALTEAAQSLDDVVPDAPVA